MSKADVVTRASMVEGVSEVVTGGVNQAAGGRPTHWHREWQLVAVTRGDGWVKSGGARHRTQAGSLFLIPPEVPHSNGVFEDGCHWRSLLIDPEVVEAATGLRVNQLRSRWDPVLREDGMVRRFVRFHQRLEEPSGEMPLEEMLSSWVVELLGRMANHQPRGVSVIAHPAAEKARECLWDRAAESISLTELPREVGLSRFELSRQFKAAFGMPPHAWQLQARVQRGKDLLKAGVPAGEAAIQLGFSDQAHFTRVFRQATGGTPAAFAAEFRKIVQDRGRSVAHRWA